MGALFYALGPRTAPARSSGGEAPVRPAALTLSRVARFPPPDVVKLRHNFRARFLIPTSLLLPPVP